MYKHLFQNTYLFKEAVGHPFRGNQYTGGGGGGYHPNVLQDSDGDGVTDAARVGVPAHVVLPPPAVPRLPNLTPEERAAESKFASDLENNPKQMASDFRKMVYASKSPTTFGTDDAKMLAKEWTGDPGEERSGRRQTLNTALHQTANAIAKRAFLDHLDTLKPGDGVMVTVGGCGAGKGYALGNVPLAKQLAGEAKAVWDSAGDQNATENPWIQKEAEKRGLKTTYAFVNADPHVSWAHPDRGVIKRANNPGDGRMVDAMIFADSYAIGAKNHAAFAEKHKNNKNVTFIYIDSSKGTPTQVDSMPKTATTVNRTDLTDFAINAVKEAKVPQTIKDGSLAGGRIWGTSHKKGDDDSKQSVPKITAQTSDDSYSWDQYVKDDISRLDSLAKTPQAGKYGGGVPTKD